MKNYLVTVELDSFEIPVKAKNQAEAKKKALQKLARKSIGSLIRRAYPSNKKEIHAEEE